MNRRLLKLGAVSATALTLAACGIMPNPLAPQQEELRTEQTSSSSNEDTDFVAEGNAEFRAKSDAQKLLGAMLTDNARGFSRLYGDSYDRWAAAGDDESIKKWIEDTGLTPEENYKVRAFDADLLPSDIYRAWLEARRDMLRDIPDDFEILSASPKDDTTMTVTAEVYGINTMELAGRVRTAKAQVLSDDWVLIINQTDDAELKKRDQMANFYLLEGMVRNEFADLDTSFSETPITSEPIKVEFDLTLDANGNWIIELEDYKALVSDLMVSDQGYQSDAS